MGPGCCPWLSWSFWLCWSCPCRPSLWPSSALSSASCVVPGLQGKALGAVVLTSLHAGFLCSPLSVLTSWRGTAAKCVFSFQLPKQ